MFKTPTLLVYPLANGLENHLNLPTKNPRPHGIAHSLHSCEPCSYYFMKDQAK
jgi:hypothetical protein